MGVFSNLELSNLIFSQNKQILTQAYAYEYNETSQVFRYFAMKKKTV